MKQVNGPPAYFPKYHPNATIKFSHGFILPFMNPMGANEDFDPCKKWLGACRGSNDIPVDKLLAI